MCLSFVNMLTEHNQEIAGKLPDTLVDRHTQSEDLGTRLSLVSRLSHELLGYMRWARMLCHTYNSPQSEVKLCTYFYTLYL